MAKVNKDELIDGIAQDYVDNSGDTATITFGNLRPKLDTAVYPKGTLEITSNGQHNVRTYENVDVDVPTGGALLNNVTRNADGTYTVIDIDNVSHIVVPIETDGQITSITFDGNVISLAFDANGNITKIGKTDMSVGNYPEPPKPGNSKNPFSNIIESVVTTAEVTKNA